MRSEFVTRAAGPITNRFLLMHVSAALTRKFHRPSKDRLPETINNSLAGLAPLKQPRCVNCGELIDVWAQFVCDDCRPVPLYKFIWKVAA